MRAKHFKPFSCKLAIPIRLVMDPKSRQHRVQKAEFLRKGTILHLCVVGIAKQSRESLFHSSSLDRQSSGRPPDWTPDGSHLFFRVEIKPEMDEEKKQRER